MDTLSIVLIVRAHSANAIQKCENQLPSQPAFLTCDKFVTSSIRDFFLAYLHLQLWTTNTHG